MYTLYGMSGSCNCHKPKPLLAHLVGEPFEWVEYPADEGGFDLSGYPATRAWLERVRARPSHTPMH